MPRTLRRHEKASTLFRHKLPCAFRDLKQWQKSLWQRRREYLITMHGWSIRDAEEEANLFVAHEIYLTEQKAVNAKAQIPLFAETKGNRTGVADTEAA